MRVPVLTALAALLSLPACQDKPNYRLRWSIEGRGVPTVTACAESGLFEVRARALSEPNRVADEIVLSCAQSALVEPEGAVGGTPLAPGRYAIELRGLDRGGTPWDDPSLEPLDPTAEVHNGCNPVNSYTECRPSELVCDCLELEVTDEDAVVTLPEFVLAPPPTCRDGIDNDNDGLVDARDPACEVDGGAGGEGLPVGLTELRISVSFFANNPNVTCGAVRATDVRFALDRGDGPQPILEATCNTDRPYLISLRVPEGTYEFSAVALGPGDEVITAPKFRSAEITAVGGSLVESIDFAAEDFIEPVVAPFNVAPVFVSTLGLDGDQPAAARSSCRASDAPGQLDIDSLLFEVTNAHGGPLDEPVVLDGAPIDDGPRPCSVANITDPVTWGGFAMRMSAAAQDGTLCFEPAQDLTPLRPREILPVALRRVYDENGLVPEACRECEADNDCGDVGGIACLDGVCQFPCEVDLDCRSEVAGDLGFSCTDVDGRSQRYCQLGPPEKDPTGGE